MKFNERTPTGSHLLTFEKAVDIGIFDGRVVTGVAATRSRQVPVAPAEEPKRKRVLPYAIAGTVLAVLGVAFIGYAGFQLWGTNVLASHSQDRLIAEFETRKAGEVPPFSTSEAATIDPAAFDDPNDIPVLVGPVDPVRPFPPEVATTTPWLYEGPPEPGAPLAHLIIPQIGLDWVVVEGVSVPDLRTGPGHMPNTAIPGQLGNAVISGHRTTWGAPFNRLNELQPGDRFTLETLIGTHTYEVVALQVVWPSETWVTTQWDGSWLTFTTCNPKYSSRHRLIVFSKLVDGPNAATVASVYGTDYQPPQYPG